ncbi:MAG: hypothetical protein QNJ13_07670 [Paracoccaceae bacterium]|nr:hypothetical protein [Paracoccaceae bacterium]
MLRLHRIEVQFLVAAIGSIRYHRHVPTILSGGGVVMRPAAFLERGYE